MTDRVPLVLKIEDWPQADKSAWECLLADGDIFGDAGACRGWSGGSRAKRAQGYRQWLSFLRRTEPKALSLSPADRIAKSRARGYFHECEARLKARTVEGLFADLLYVDRAMAPARDWDWLRITLNRLIARANRVALPPPVDSTAGRIFRWGLDRMAEVEADGSLEPLLRAIRFRQALMIAFLIARPVRRRALLAMRVDTHLVPVGGGFDLRFTAEDMKNSREWSCPLPGDLVGPIKRYLAGHRAVLLGARRSPFLWISQYGEPLTADGLSRELPKITERHLGVALRPHKFRHIAATSIAEIDPEHVNIIRDLLGHATLQMSERHYNRATSISSCTRVQSIVEDIRSGMHRMGRARSPATRSKGAR